MNIFIKPKKKKHFHSNLLKLGQVVVCSLECKEQILEMLEMKENTVPVENLNTFLTIQVFSLKEIQGEKDILIFENTEKAFIFIQAVEALRSCNQSQSFVNDYISNAKILY